MRTVLAVYLLVFLDLFAQIDDALWAVLPAQLAQAASDADDDDYLLTKSEQAQQGAAAVLPWSKARPRPSEAPDRRFAAPGVRQGRAVRGQPRRAF
jgi:hypothetical protein